MPAAQRLLDESGLSASDVPATGPGGRLLKEDVQKYLESGAAKTASKPEPKPEPKVNVAKLIDKATSLYKRGNVKGAVAEFNKALKINARNTMARKGLRQIQEKREADKKGLFRKMFR